MPVRRHTYFAYGSNLCVRQLVAHDPPTIVGPVGAEEAADALLAFLARHDYLDDVTVADIRPGSTR